MKNIQVSAIISLSLMLSSTMVCAETKDKDDAAARREAATFLYSAGLYVMHNCSMLKINENNFIMALESLNAKLSEYTTTGPRADDVRFWIKKWQEKDVDKTCESLDGLFGAQGEIAKNVFSRNYR